MRRADREVAGLDGILAILDQCEVARLGLCAEGRPYIVPLFFAYEVVDGTMTLYFHCATEGRKLELIAANSRACFEADCAVKILRGERACGWSAEYASVMGEGEIVPVNEAGQKAAALSMLMKRYGFAGEPRFSTAELAACAVLRLTARAITGKRRGNGAGQDDI